jgi:predicted transcriptional regulator
MTEETAPAGLVAMTADIVGAYLANATLAPAEIPPLIQSVYGALLGVTGAAGSADALEPQKPAVPIKKSITPEFLISLEDGRKYKSLKRHLRTAYNLSPEEYRAKWGLPKDYPMVAPDYAAARSAMAKTSGLGSRGRVAVAKPARKPRTKTAT